MEKLIPNLLIRWFVGVAAIFGLVGLFLFQQTNIAGLLGIHDRTTIFFVNRTFRFLLNDFFTICLIYALFHERKYLIFSLWVQLVGIFLFLLPYFILKYYYPAYNGPLINFLHRLIVNPTLLLLLIIAFYHQRLIAKR